MSDTRESIPEDDDMLAEVGFSNSEPNPYVGRVEGRAGIDSAIDTDGSAAEKRS